MTSENVITVSDTSKLTEQIKAYDSLSDSERLDYFCAVINKLVTILSKSDKNVFESVVDSLNVSPRYHKQLLNSGLLILFNNIWTHQQLISLCNELLQYNEEFVCNTGNDLSSEDLSHFIFSKIKE
jgi:hypothetical protein